MKEAEKRKLEEIETKDSTRPAKQMKIEDNFITQNSDEEIVDTDVSMPSTSPESDSEKSTDYSSVPGTPEQDITIEENSDNFGSGGDESVRPRQLDTIATESTLENFRNALAQGKESEFIQEFIDDFRSGNVSSEDDVYSLLLNRAVGYRDIKIIKHILSLEHEANILTTVDSSHTNPISSVLASGNKEMLGIFDKYINTIYQKLENGQIKKADFINQDDADDTYSIIKFPEFEGMTSASCLFNYLYPLYSKEALQPLIDLIGDEHLTELVSDS